MAAAERPPREPARRATPPRDLLHHGLVGGLLGFPLAIWLSGLLYYAADAAQDPATYQIAMWTVPMLWAGITALAFMAPGKRDCWLALLAANALAFGVLKTVQA
ncbi:hypothetical protein V8Z74_19030 [Comamonas sp. w2-DMI]|uniref:hypothetical protein n=1 Tax=Comamonas sp. w2-DMI TaxID=3126391 RepID=UPI0032E47B99